MFKFLIFGCGFLLAMAVYPTSALAADAEVLTIAISNWPPYKSEDLPRGGIVTDVTTKALKRAGYEVAVTVVPWKRALQGTIIGKYDVLPAVWKTPERAEKLNFGDAVITSRIVIASHSDYDFEFGTLEDLRGLTVGVAAGWGYPDAFQNADFILKEESSSLEQSLRKMVFGRIKLAIVEEFASRHTMSANFTDAAPTINYSKIALQENALHVAFSKEREGYEELTERFNAALESMNADGAFQKIMIFHGVQSATE